MLPADWRRINPSPGCFATTLSPWERGIQSKTP
jgi:hypothetical protein